MSVVVVVAVVVTGADAAAAVVVPPSDPETGATEATGNSVNDIIDGGNTGATTGAGTGAAWTVGTVEVAEVPGTALAQSPAVFINSPLAMPTQYGCLVTWS